METKKIIYPVVLALCFIGIFAFGAWVGATKIAYHVPQPGTLDFSLFWDAYNKLQGSYISPSEITTQKVIHGAIRGMTDSVGDPYTNFFNPQQAQRFYQDLQGSFEGIGVEIGIKNELLTVVAPLKGTPGERVGLKSGDVIVKINGQDSANMTTEEAVTLIRGKKGTTVTLSIFRGGWNLPREFKIVRDTIKVASIEWSLKNGDVAYIQMYQFDENLSNDFKQVALQILQSPAKKIVLDLRNNPGGYLEVAQNIAGWFLAKDQIVTIEDFGKDKEQQFFKTNGTAQLSGYPTVVLINEGSASASEILAGALRDNRKIQLVGKKSFGKGSVQEVVGLKDGSFLKVTIAHWLTPKGSYISNVGLAPDVRVELTEKDSEDKKDPQLEKALEIAGNLK